MRPAYSRTAVSASPSSSVAGRRGLAGEHCLVRYGLASPEGRSRGLPSQEEETEQVDGIALVDNSIRIELIDEEIRRSCFNDLTMINNRDLIA